MSGSGFFVRAREQQKLWTKREREREEGEEQKEKRGGASAQSGEEVKEFYQSLFEEDGGGERRGGRGGGARGKGRRGADGRRASARRAPESTAPPAGRTEGYRLLSCAERGDVSGLEKLLRRGCGVHFRDGFNWTALMSAAYAGRTEAVRVLLHRGATWRGITDRQGRDARDLALLAGHGDVVELLGQYDRTHHTHRAHTPTEPTHSPPAVPRWCEVCEVRYSDDAHTHRSSTLHQFSLTRPPSAPHYCLAPSSAGYRMMLRLGWNPHSGLGPAHEGRLRPVSTVLKSDKAGVGFGEAPRPKVTHFGARDTGAVVRRAPKWREESRESSARERRRREERDRQWERDYRASFNSQS